MALAAQKLVNNARRAWSNIGWLAVRANRRAQSRLTLLRRRVTGSPPPPLESDGRLRVHLGCGPVIIPGFINVDAWPAAHVHYVHDVTRLPMFADDSTDLVYACHVLEHISPGRHVEVLWEWRRTLKAGGILRLSVPDFDRLVEIYEACARDVTSIQNPLIGDEGHNRHAAVINRAYLEGALEAAGFRETRPWDPKLVEHAACVDWSSKTIQRLGRPWHISLNLEAVK
jgi:predicted SAM-dependent methyltransferase